MGKLSKYLYGIMAAAMLAGCSDDGIAPDVDGGNKPTNGDGGSVYMQVTIVPSFGPNAASRSVTVTPNDDYSTSNSGIEIGNEDENRIYNVMLILAGPKNEFISYSLIGGLGNNNQNPSGKEDPDAAEGTKTDPLNNSVTINTSFSRADIDNFYSEYIGTYTFGTAEGADKIRVYALCNYTQDMLKSIQNAASLKTNWANSIQKVDEYSAASGIPNSGISILDTKGGLYMANATVAERMFPAEAQDWDAFSNENNPFDLSGESIIPNEDGGATKINNSIINGSRSIANPVKVERGMARFDFADGSEGANGASPVNPSWNADDQSTWNTYIIGQTTDGKGETTNTLKVKLVRMCLVNMSNTFYCIRHMAKNVGVGMEAAAEIPATPYDPYDAEGILNPDIPALWESFFLCVAEDPWTSGTGGAWTTGNWVIDPDYYWKSQFPDYSNEQADVFPYERYFNFPLGNRGFNEGDGTIDPNNGWGITPSARNGWYTSKINDVLAGREDQNFDNWGLDLYDYHIWRYVTENTLPSIKAQKNAISTGVVFKGLLLPGDNCPDDLKQALNTGEYTYTYTDANGVEQTKTVEHPNLYLFDEVLYVSWDQVEATAIEHKAGSPLYNTVFGDTPMKGDGSVDFDNLDPNSAAALFRIWQEKAPGNLKSPEYYAFRDKIVNPNGDLSENNNGFAIYQWSEVDENDDTDLEDAKEAGKVDGNDRTGGYFCYYYYWNRHNDNGKNGVMGPMEFQVVRNNVYKLAVTEISKIGHPRRTSNDPDPEEPKKDDEESKLYFKVQVEVLPWAVRVNNITF